MKLLLIYLLCIFMIVMLISILIIFFSKKSLIDLEKSSPFECGFSPMAKKRMPFSIHFFMIAIIFLIFDVEIIIILPSILTMKLVMVKYWLITSITFMVILIIGLYYEWMNGLLNWEF